MGSAPQDPRRWTVLAVCCLSLFLVGLDTTIVNVGLPSIGAGLDVGTRGLEWTVDAYTLVVASLLISSGALADRIGRRRVFRLGLVVFGAASVVCALAPTIGVLIAARMAQGVGASMLSPVALAIVVNLMTEPEERARAIGVWAAVFGVSMAAGPVAGGALVTAAGWRSVFWINVPVVAVALVLIAVFVPESRGQRPRRLDGPGQLLLIVVVGGSVAVLIEGPRIGWGSPAAIAGYSAVVVATAAFGVVESRRAEPLVDPRLFRRPPFVAAVLGAVVVFVAFSATLLLNTLYLQHTRGLTPIAVGVVTLPMAVAVTVCAPLSGVLVGRSGPRPPLALAGAFVTAGGLCLVGIGTDTDLRLLSLFYLLIGIGFGFANAPITNTAVSGLPLDPRRRRGWDHLHRPPGRRGLRYRRRGQHHHRRLAGTSRPSRTPGVAPCRRLRAAAARREPDRAGGRQAAGYAVRPQRCRRPAQRLPRSMKTSRTPAGRPVLSKRSTRGYTVEQLLNSNGGGRWEGGRRSHPVPATTRPADARLDLPSAARHRRDAPRAAAFTADGTAGVGHPRTPARGRAGHRAGTRPPPPASAPGWIGRWRTGDHPARRGRAAQRRGRRRSRAATARGGPHRGGAGPIVRCRHGPLGSGPQSYAYPGPGRRTGRRRGRRRTCRVRRRGPGRTGADAALSEFSGRGRRRQRARRSVHSGHCHPSAAGAGRPRVVRPRHRGGDADRPSGDAGSGVGRADPRPAPMAAVVVGRAARDRHGGRRAQRDGDHARAGAVVVRPRLPGDRHRPPARHQPAPRSVPAPRPHHDGGHHDRDRSPLHGPGGRRDPPRVALGARGAPRLRLHRLPHLALLPRIRFRRTTADRGHRAAVPDVPRRRPAPAHAAPVDADRRGAATSAPPSPHRPVAHGRWSGSGCSSAAR